MVVKTSRTFVSRSSFNPACLRELFSSPRDALSCFCLLDEIKTRELAAAGRAGWAGGRVSVQMESDKLLPVTELASPGDPRCRSDTAAEGKY